MSSEGWEGVEGCRAGPDLVFWYAYRFEVSLRLLAIFALSVEAHDDPEDLVHADLHIVTWFGRVAMSLSGMCPHLIDNGKDSGLEAIVSAVAIHAQVDGLHDSGGKLMLTLLLNYLLVIWLLNLQK